jgi:hypothetical protein
MATTKGAAMQERFLYHSFPRRDRNSAVEIDTGCKVLSLIRDAGLLLAPEVVKWQYSHADGTSPRKQEIQQTRVCFTELSPSELPRHAESFGHFALEFRIDMLKGLGAIPVFYIPQGVAGTPAELGSMLVMQSIDAAVLAGRLAQVKQDIEAAPSVITARREWKFGSDTQKLFSLDVAETSRVIEALTYALTPPDMLFHGLMGLLYMFYPADDVSHDDALAYYRQREWRIARNFAIRGEDVMRRPSEELIKRALNIDATFWGDEFPRGSGSRRRRAEQLLVYQGIGGKRIIEMVNRVIVPPQAVERAQDILKGLNPPPPVVSLAEF